MSRSLYSGVNKVYFRSYLLLNIVASSAYIFEKQIYNSLLNINKVEKKFMKTEIEVTKPFELHRSTKIITDLLVKLVAKNCENIKK